MKAAEYKNQKASILTGKRPPLIAVVLLSLTAAAVAITVTVSHVKREREMKSERELIAAEMSSEKESREAFLEKYGERAGVFTDERDGRVYLTVKIGKQTWMAENLAYLSDGGCNAYNDDKRNVAKYGYLYKWKMASKVAPDGWHLPDEKEWKELIEFTGGEYLAGHELKAAGLWDRQDSKDTGKSGFSALPGGFRAVNPEPKGTSLHMGIESCFWSGAESDDALGIHLSNNSPDVAIQRVQETRAYSIRCIKD
ncbi:MAG TPA: fibrobacter succinogenes major paralogous domain-containing protein [Spirochaetota bacterium]|nr:fibrobacter succinogenes major paralogous domain-containing protein [Spirochaetota bacterium]HPJ35930.1 fibrobacter succinogenes major paralogous domain-containing protein [Spirochaetota bacterium]